VGGIQMRRISHFVVGILISHPLPWVGFLSFPKLSTARLHFIRLGLE
jgi:hypothetical protein